MGQVICQIPDQETRHERRDPLRSLEQNSQDQVEQSEENGYPRDTYREWHDQTGFHLRLGMVDAVEQKEDAFLARAGWLVMEKEAVQGILGQGPEAEADQKTQQNGDWKSEAGGFHHGIDDQ